MANTITDNRTLVDSADVVGTVWVTIGGTAATTPDAEIKIQGAASMGIAVTTTREGRFYRYAADQDLSNTHAYIWVNCGIVGLLSTKAAQGCTFRARGPTITNYLEWDLAGSDSWPTAVAGGWVQFVIDLSSTPTRTAGTPPATTAIRELGVTFITASIMPRMADNTWVDEIRTLADGTPGIIVQGRNGGTTDWKWADLPTQLTQTAGTARNGPAGTIILNTPVQFFVDDATTHAFTSINETVLWDNQEFAAPDLYSVTVLGAASGTANWSMGLKTGTGVNATGAQGGAIIADSSGVRWGFDADIANIDTCNFYGTSCVHGGDFQLDAVSTEVVNTLFIDSTNVEASNSNLFLKNSYVDSNTATDAGSLVWNENVNVDGILDGSTFEKGTNSHHAIDFGASVATDITLRNCSFNGFGSTDDADDSTVRFLGSTDLTLSLVNCTVNGGAATASNFSIDATSATITLSISPVTTFINIKDPDGNNEAGVRVYLQGTYVDSGSHTGANDASVLTDSTQTWTDDEFIGYKVVNTTDGSVGDIISNTSNTITATLVGPGGADKDWDTNDNYIINADLPVDEPVTITRSGITATVTHYLAHGLLVGEYVKLSGITNANRQEDNSGAFTILTVPSTTTYTYETTDSGDTTYTGDIRATGATIYGLTDDPGGNISSSRTYGRNQPLTGYARKITDGVTPPFYKTIELDDVVDSSAGLTISRRLVLDQ